MREPSTCLRKVVPVAVILLICTGLLLVWWLTPAHNEKRRYEGRQGSIVRTRDDMEAVIRTKDDMLRFYRALEANASCPASRQSEFVIKMQEVGPQIVPALVEAIIAGDVHEIIGWDAIRHIDMKHGTSCFVDSLLTAKLSPRERELAVAFASSYGAHSTVLGLERVASDETQTQSKRQKASVLARDILNVIISQPDHDLHYWASDRIQSYSRTRPSPLPSGEGSQRD